MSEPMRFLLTGTFNSANKGDAGMKLSAAVSIVRRYPGSTATVMSPFPDMDRPFYDPIPVERCNRRRLISATIDLIRAALWRRFGGDWLLSREMRLVRESDLVIDLSGDMLTEDYGPHIAYSHYIPILRALILGRPYFLCAQSIGPFKLTRPLARLILDRAVAITARDRITREYLERFGVASDRVEETADLSFLLDTAGEDRAAAILESEGIALDGRRPVLGVSVSQLMAGKYRKRNPGASDQDFITMMKTVIEGAARDHGAQVVFISHVTGPTRGNDDRIIAAELREALDPTLRAWVLTGDYRPEELKALIARCDVFCGARMHACIAALSSRVPTVAMAYSHKAPGIMASCGMEEFVAPVESMTATSLGRLIARAFAEREVLSAQLEERIPAVRGRAMTNIERLAELAAPDAEVGAPAGPPGVTERVAR